MAWEAPVIDRSEQDIINRTPKGFMNFSDLNRIEGNCEILGEWFDVGISTRTWSRNDFPAVSEFERIRNNIISLREAYYTLPMTPDTPDSPLTSWSKINDIEQILFDLHDLYLKVLQSLYYVGEIYAGEEIGVI